MTEPSDDKVFDPDLIEVTVITAYLPEHSNPENEQYTFAYNITVQNYSDTTVQLLSRHWLITDANNDVQEVYGEGVVGEQPVILPGSRFRYSSGATLATPVGSMQGEYHIITQGGKIFDVPIAPFSLNDPSAVN